MGRRLKKIAVVVPRYGRVGGGERFVMALTEQLAAIDGLQMHVFANHWDTNSPNVHFHKVPIITFPRFLTTLSFAYLANKRIAAAGMDLIHTHDRILNADLFTAHGLPHATWIREVRRKRPSLFDRTTAWVERRLVISARCRAILPVSTLVKEKMIAAFPRIEDKIRVMTPGVDTAPFDVLDRHECRVRIRRQFGIAETDRVILFVGMNFEVKGMEAILAAMGRLKQRQPEVATRLLVIGKGDVKRYRGIARQLGIEKNVLFAGVWRDEIAPVYLAADLFALLSVHDTFGLAVLEAMAAGLPVIISPTVGARDILRSGENGYIVDSSNTEEVSRLIAQALEPKENAQLARCARQTAQAHSWPALAREVAGIYDELLRPDGLVRNRQGEKT
jgi:UDP-glucose:(heptosyl)LPS alpha-1,3-glucosyltransferase